MKRRRNEVRNELGLLPGMNIFSREEFGAVLLSGRGRDDRKFFDHVGRLVRHFEMPERVAFDILNGSIDDGLQERLEGVVPMDCLRVRPGPVAGNNLVRRDLPDRFFRGFLEWASDRSQPGLMDVGHLCGTPRDQGRRGTCLAHAACRSMESLLALDGSPGVDLSEEDFYYRCKSIDGVPNQSGTTLAASEEVALETGFCEERYWPYRPYRDPNRNEGHGPPPESAHRAPRLRPAEVINLPSWMDPEDRLLLLRWFLAERRIVPILVIPCFPSMAAARFSGNVPVPLPGERPWGYHALNATAYDRDAGVVVTDNSWGAWSSNPRGRHRLNYSEAFFEKTKWWVQVQLDEEAVEFLHRFEGGVPRDERADDVHVNDEEDMEESRTPAAGASEEAGITGNLALLAAVMALLPIAALVWAAGTPRVLGEQWLDNLILPVMVFGVLFGSGTFGLGRLLINLIPLGALAGGAALALGQVLSGGWLVFGTLSALTGVLILASLFTAGLGSLFGEAGRRLRGLLEQSPPLAALDSLAAQFLAALAFVLIADVAPRFGVHYALGLQIVAGFLERLLG